MDVTNDKSMRNSNSIKNMNETTSSSMTNNNNGRPPTIPKPRLDWMKVDVSNCSHRSSLRQSIVDKTHHLTMAEQDYLHTLCIEGNDIEVQMAHDKLLDTDVFFPITPKLQQQPSSMMMDDSDTTMGWKSDTIQLNYDDGNDTSFRNSTGSNMFLRQSDSAALLLDLQNPSLSMEELQNSHDSNTKMVLSSSDDLGESIINDNSRTALIVGSERRQSRLQERRLTGNTALHLWKAHESGLGISKQSSRRSIFGRNHNKSLKSSMAMNGSSNSSSNDKMKLLNLNPNIFRPHASSNDALSKPTNSTTTVTRTRHVSWHSGPLMARTKTLQQQQNLSSSNSSKQFHKIRPTVRRMRSESEGSRKSVTFHKDVVQQPVIRRELLTNRSASMPPMILPRRSSSASSIPSLHPAVPLVTSPTSTTSVSQTIKTVPSIHLAHSIRSSSATSLLSDTSDITISERFQNSNIFDTGEEKKTADIIDEIINNNEHKKLVWESSLMLDRNNDETVQDAIKVLHSNDSDVPIQLYPDYTVTESNSTATTTTDIPLIDTISGGISHLQNRRVMMRKASTNFDQGEGIEVTDIVSSSADDSEYFYTNMNNIPAMADYLTVKSSNSFDDAILLSSQKHRHLNNNNNNIFRRLLRRSLSDEGSGIFVGKPILLMDNNSNSIIATTEFDESWNNRSSILTNSNKNVFDTEDDDDYDDDYYDSWKVVDDEYENGYGGGGTLPFLILGTSASDVDAHPHVLSPPLMESLQSFLPIEISSNNFWMKFSMVRDGSSFHTFLQHARGSKYTILAIETVDGEVFGAFTAEAWRKSWNYFGTGESFLWKMRHNRHIKCHSIIDQAHMESEIDVYPYIGFNNCIQLCTHDKIAVGGGTYVSSPTFESDVVLNATSNASVQDQYKAHEWGFGITIENDFLYGTSSPCLTFGSPSLSTLHKDGSMYEIMNIELWTFTPCHRLEDAEKLELGKLFLEGHSKKQ